MVATKNLTISEGNDKTFNVVITQSGTDIPIDISGYTFLYTAKTNKDDSDDDAVISKTITSHTVPASGQTSIPIVRADTLNKNLGTLYHDYQWNTSGTNLRQTVFIGNLTVRQSIGDKELI